MFSLTTNRTLCYSDFRLMKTFSILILAIFSLFIFAKNVEAKVLPQAKGAQKAISKSTGSINISPRLRADRRALNVYFSNLQNAKSVSYMLTYNTSTQQEGAMGALNLTGSSSQTQELLFGTCSKNVCRYHTGIKDARLEVSYSLKSGKKYLKKFKIKV